MLVRLTFGRQAGEVVDLLPLSARAMIADGRAVWPDAEPDNAGSVAVERVASREDRGMPRTRKRVTR